MIHLSPSAASEILRLKSRQPNSRFRLSVHPGGCADFYYNLSFDETFNSKDQIWNCEGVEIIVDSQSFELIDGLTLDYSEDLMGGGFRFHNPKAVQSCGCGSSFTLEQDPAVLKDCA